MTAGPGSVHLPDRVCKCLKTLISHKLLLLTAKDYLQHRSINTTEGCLFTKCKMILSWREKPIYYTWTGENQQTSSKYAVTIQYHSILFKTLKYEWVKKWSCMSSTILYWPRYLTSGWLLYDDFPLSYSVYSPVTKV